jgi:predicted exporter
MVQKTATNTNGSIDALIQDCANALQKMAAHKLPAALDRRLLWLSENKENLSEAEREELLALVDFSEDRTVEKLQAKVILRRFATAWPQLFESAP